MDNLAKCLRYYIADRLNNDPGWRNITVREPVEAAIPSCQQGILEKMLFGNRVVVGHFSLNFDPGLPV